MSMRMSPEEEAKGEVREVHHQPRPLEMKQLIRIGIMIDSFHHSRTRIVLVEACGFMPPRRRAQSHVHSPVLHAPRCLSKTQVPGRGGWGKVPCCFLCRGLAGFATEKHPNPASDKGSQSRAAPQLHGSPVHGSSGRSTNIWNALTSGEIGSKVP